MEKEKEKCYFLGHGKLGCRALAGVKCSGLDTNCSFFKTKEKFYSDRDKAIDINREKGRCHGCKYNQIPCVKSNEELKKT